MQEAKARNPERGKSGKPDLGMLDLEKLDAYLEEARQIWQVPGMSVALVKGDEVVFARGYGRREYGQPGKVDEHTVFGIASITKGFTVSALGMLDDTGELDWDDPVRDYLPDFTLYDPWVSEDMRIRDLLCHRSGLKDFSGDLLWYETEYTRDDLMQRIRFLEPSYAFRYRFGYSNLMYLAAGQIIPSVTGMDWEAFVRSRILEPLGMERTFLSREEFIRDPNRAVPHHVDILEEKTRVLPTLNSRNIAPAMAMNSSAADMARWIRFQLKMGNWEGGQLLSPENVWETRTMHMSRPTEPADRRIWPSMHFRGYGLGWELCDYHGWKIIAHEGATDGMISRLVFIPDLDFGFVILTNSLSAIALGLQYYILDQYFEGQSYDWCAIYLASVRSTLKETERDWDEYLASVDRSIEATVPADEFSGTYRCRLYGDVEVKAGEGGLDLDFLPAPGLGADLEHLSGDTFLIRIVERPYFPEGRAWFETDGKGRVSGLEIRIPIPDFDFGELNLRKTD